MYLEEDGKVEVQCYFERDPTREKLRDRLWVESISEVIRRSRLHWFGHVDRSIRMAEFC